MRNNKSSKISKDHNLNNRMIPRIHHHFHKYKAQNKIKLNGQIIQTQKTLKKLHIQIPIRQKITTLIRVILIKINLKIKDNIIKKNLIMLSREIPIII
jgi:hypothetical protein